jgi:hypothetical protein
MKADDVVAEPLDQLGARNPTGGKAQHQRLLLDLGVDLEAVQDQECLHGGMRNPFVAVQERVVLHERVAERGRLVDEGRVEIDAIECVPRLRQSRFKCPEVTHTSGTSRGVDDGAVQFNDFAQTEAAHQARRR